MSFFGVGSPVSLIEPLTIDNTWVLGSAATLLFAAMVLRHTAKPNPGVARDSQASIATYHNEVRQRIDSQSSVRYLRSRCAEVTRLNRDDLLEFHPRKVKLTDLSNPQLNNHLTFTTLYGKDRLSDSPMFRIRINEPPSEADPGFTLPLSDSTSEISANYTHVTFIHLGAALCGHHRIIHGGLLATIIEELVSAQAISYSDALISQLTIDYRHPVFADQVVRGRVWTTRCEDQKIWVRGLLEGIEKPSIDNLTAANKAAKEPITDKKVSQGRTLVDVHAVFIVPSSSDHEEGNRATSLA